MADRLIDAIRTRKLAEVRAAVPVGQASGLSNRTVVEAPRLAFTKALALLHKSGADLNGTWRGYHPLHALLQKNPHASTGDVAEAIERRKLIPLLAYIYSSRSATMGST